MLIWNFVAVFQNFQFEINKKKTVLKFQILLAERVSSVWQHLGVYRLQLIADIIDLQQNIKLQTAEHGCLHIAVAVSWV